MLRHLYFAGTAGEVLSLNETLALARKLSFNPYLECAFSLLRPQSTSFLGPLHKLRTGELVLSRPEYCQW